MSLPEALSYCEVCDEEPGPAGMLRCSRCRNKFYCGAGCQREDWKKHKMDCSLLPLMPLPSPDIKPSEELEAEVRRVEELLKAIRDSWKDLEKDQVVGQPPNEAVRRAKRQTHEFKKLSTLEFAPEFAYDRAQELPPLKRTLIRIIRLYFLHDIAHLSSQVEADALVEFFAGCQLPSSFPQLFGPKIVARPGDLSPGEYGMIVKILPIRYMPQSKEGEPEKQRSDRWMNLAGIWQC